MEIPAAVIPRQRESSFSYIWNPDLVLSEAEGLAPTPNNRPVGCADKRICRDRALLAIAFEIDTAIDAVRLSPHPAVPTEISMPDATPLTTL